MVLRRRKSMRSVCIHSSERLNLDAFLHELDVPVRFEFEGYDEERSYYYFSRPGISLLCLS